jgi:drug/metabolite transporter (DMT)-like permease
VSAAKADLVLIAATAVWGVSFVVVKDALSAASPLAFVAIRFALAAVLMAPFIDLSRPFTRAELGAGVVLTVLLASGFATQAVGLVYTTPARSAFIVALSSVVAPVVAFLVLRHRPRAVVLLALLVATVGLYYLTAPDAGGLNRGDLWTLGTAVVFGAQIVAVAEVAGRFNGPRLVWLQLVGTAAAVAPAALLLERVRVSWSWQLVGALIYTAVVATALAFVWQMRAQRSMSAARAALIFCCEPLFAALASWLWLGETLASSQWLGGALILGGMLLAELPVRATSRDERTQGDSPGTGP